MTIRKIVLVAVLLAGMVFVILQWSSFLSPSTFLNNERVSKVKVKEDDPLKTNDNKLATLKDDVKKYQISAVTNNSISIKGNTVIRQTFISKHRLIKQVRLHFANPSNYTATGTVTVSIRDGKKKTITASTLPAKLLANQSATIFDFLENANELNGDKIIHEKITNYKRDGIPIKKGKKYTLEVKSSNMASKEKVGLFLCDENHRGDGNQYTINGNKENQRIFGVIKYFSINAKVFLLLLTGLLLTAIGILLPRESIDRSLSRRTGKNIDTNKILTRIMFFDTPLVCFIIIEKFHGPTLGSIFGKLFSIDGLLNLLIIGLFWWLIYTIWNRCKYTIITLTGIAFGFGVTNYVLLLFRDSPLAATDFASMGTAADVVGNYTMHFNQAFLWCLVIAMIHIAIALSLQQYKSFEKKKQRLAALLALLVWGGVFYTVIFATEVLEKHDIYVSGFRPKWSYNSHGYTLAFFLTVKSIGVDQPDGYSKEAAAGIAKNYVSDKAVPATNISKKNPNIIVVMNEAYADLSYISKFSTNKDYCPFFNSLKEDTVTGTMHTSIFGGSTANTEFEFLTGNTLAYLPFHSVAYNNHVKVPTPSLTTTLKSRGYGGNVAFHPGMNTSYNRNVVYPNLGFDTYISLENLKKPELLRAYVSDAYDYKTIRENYRQFRQKNPTSPYYMFNVTIQNHSDFALSSGVVDEGIGITDAELQMEEAGQYLNLIKKSDDALRQLIQYYRQQSEPTVVVLFGDHQPRIEDDFYQKLMDRAGSNLTDLERSELQYRVPFMIWANFDIKEKKNVDISANFLHPYLLKMLGQPMTGYDKFLLDLHKQIPFSTAIAYKDKNGKLYPPTDSSSDVYPLLEKYQILQYNNIIDTENRIQSFFYLRK